jgi:hypothetical protein
MPSLLCQLYDNGHSLVVTLAFSSFYGFSQISFAHPAVGLVRSMDDRYYLSIYIVRLIRSTCPASGLPVDEYELNRIGDFPSRDNGQVMLGVFMEL